MLLFFFLVCFCSVVLAVFGGFLWGVGGFLTAFDGFSMRSLMVFGGFLAFTFTSLGAVCFYSHWLSVFGDEMVVELGF